MCLEASDHGPCVVAKSTEDYLGGKYLNATICRFPSVTLQYATLWCSSRVLLSVAP